MIVWFVGVRQPGGMRFAAVGSSRADLREIYRATWRREIGAQVLRVAWPVAVVGEA